MALNSTQLSSLPLTEYEASRRNQFNGSSRLFVDLHLPISCQFVILLCITKKVLKESPQFHIEKSVVSSWMERKVNSDMQGRERNQSGVNERQMRQVLDKWKRRARAAVTEERETERQLTKSEELWQMTNQAGNGRENKKKARIMPGDSLEYPLSSRSWAAF